MSRIGKLPVPVGKNVQVEIAGARVNVKGPKGELSREFPAGVSFTLDDGKVVVARVDDEKKTRAIHGLSRSPPTW
jgi:large subunit ribosomal protein L6